MGAHWNTQNTSKYITIHVMYFDVFCVFQWAPITILPPLGQGWGVCIPVKKVLLRRRSIFIICTAGSTHPRVRKFYGPSLRTLKCGPGSVITDPRVRNYVP